MESQEDSRIWPWAAAVLSVFLGYYFRAVLLPVLFGLLLAYAVNPVVSWLRQTFGLPNRLSAVIILIACGVLTSVLSVLFGRLATEQITQLGDNLPVYQQRISEAFGVDDVVDVDRWFTDIGAAIEKNPLATAQSLVPKAVNALGVASALAGSVVGLATVAMLTLIAFYQFVAYYESMCANSLKLIPPRHRETATQILAECDRIFASFVRGRVTIGLLQCVLFSFGYWLINMPYWLILGIATGLLCILPLVGFVGWPVAIAVKYIDNASSGGSLEWIDILVWPSAVQLTIQCIELWVLTPLVQGQSLRMNPLTVVVAILIGGTVFGVFGVFVALPLGGCVQMILRDYWWPYYQRTTSDGD